MQDRKEVMKRWCGVMEWLDRLGYLTAGFSLLVLGMLIFAHAWYTFITKAGQGGLLPYGLRLLNDLLLVIILLELFRTVIRFLQTEVLDLEPYLAVGIIACTRRVLTASAELSVTYTLSASAPTLNPTAGTYTAGQLVTVTSPSSGTTMRYTQFYQYLMDVGLNVTVIMVLVVGVFLVRKRPAQSPVTSP